MKKIILFLFLTLGVLGYGQITTTPAPAIATGAVTINFDKAGTPLASSTGTLYAHIGVTVDGVVWQKVIGTWANNATQPAFTLVSGTKYKLDLTPDLFTKFGVPTTSTISQICIVIRNDAATQQSADTFLPVGAFQVSLTAPAAGSTTIVTSGSSFTIAANNTGGNAAYTLKSNGSTINTNAATASYTYTQTNITANQNYELTVTQGTTSVKRNFTVIVNPTVVSAALPTGVADGINYGTDATKATLVLNAPGKDFVYVAGSFNNWQPTSAYAMKQDPATGKFWLELTGLTSGAVNTFQYWVIDQTPTTNSQVMVKTADPFSTLVLSPDDDPYITAVQYPNLPAYPAGQSYDVSVLQTAQAAYNWQVTDFVKPAKEDLVIYELLVRDFDSEKTWDGLAAKIDYLKNLHINAIEIMPVMEFEGNISWGYNTAFHMANDKAYGTADSMKAFIDLCHQNGIAVILDVALNHVYGRSPLARLWANDPDGDGYGAPNTDNPYCNTVAKHTYSVGNDLNHQSTLTQYYVERTIQHWMNEFNIDGFRWDLTKGFTQECTDTDEVCTNAYHSDRVKILEKYADMQWAIDPDFLVIFEHLGIGTGANSSAAEEVEWSNYRANEGKGIMLWNNLNGAYNENTMGYSNSNSNFNNVDFKNKGFTYARAVGFAESHDEERLMYKNLLYGAASGTYNVKTLATALERTKALGAMLLTVPGPKMIWQFGELGYDFGINRCADNTYNNDCRTDAKPIPSEIGYTTDANRMAVYETWSKIINIRTSNPVFHTSTFTVTSGTSTPRIDIKNESLAADALRYVIILANFDTTAKTVNTNFTVAGDWYNLMDNTVVSGSTTTVTLQPGEFRILGNKQAILGTAAPVAATVAALYPNPASNQFSINITTQKVEVYAITGQLVKVFGATQAGNTYDVSSLNNGIYLVKITDGNNRQSTTKLIKG